MQMKSSPVLAGPRSAVRCLALMALAVKLMLWAVLALASVLASMAALVSILLGTSVLLMVSTWVVWRLQRLCLRALRQAARPAGTSTAIAQQTARAKLVKGC